jgi:hypothetical protein
MVAIFQTVVFWIWHTVVLEWSLPLFLKKSEGYVPFWYRRDQSQVIISAPNFFFNKAFSVLYGITI